MHDVGRTSNLLGATALAISDAMLATATQAAGASASGAAALVTLLSAEPGMSVTELGRRIGLTQPAAARMVDSLQNDQLVRRRPGPGKSVRVRLSAKGKRAARRLLAARADPLAELVSTLDERSQQQLAELLPTLLARLQADVGNPDLLCRLCDRAACTRDAACPVGQAAREQG